MTNINIQMKKVALLSALSSFLTASTTFAQTPTPNPNNIIITPPVGGYKDLGAFITNIMTLAFSLAILLVLIMLIWGAFEWITSGGDKDNVGKARGKIINALIGLAVLAVAFALARAATQFLGFGNFSNISVPTPNPNAIGI